MPISGFLVFNPLAIVLCTVFLLKQESWWKPRLVCYDGTFPWKGGKFSVADLLDKFISSNMDVGGNCLCLDFW